MTLPQASDAPFWEGTGLPLSTCTQVAEPEVFHLVSWNGHSFQEGQGQVPLQSCRGSWQTDVSGLSSTVSPGSGQAVHHRTECVSCGGKQCSAPSSEAERSPTGHRTPFLLQWDGHVSASLANVLATSVLVSLPISCNPQHFKTCQPADGGSLLRCFLAEVLQSASPELETLHPSSLWYLCSGMLTTLSSLSFWL